MSVMPFATVFNCSTILTSFHCKSLLVVIAVVVVLSPVMIT